MKNKFRNCFNTGLINLIQALLLTSILNTTNLPSPHSMYNVFSYDKQMSKTVQFEQMKDRFVKDELSRRKTQEKLSSNYKRRVENFVLQMADKPIVTHDFLPPVVNIRDEDPSRFVGGPSFIVRAFKHERERIKDNIEDYQAHRKEYLDTKQTYKNAPFEFRRRDFNKEIQPMMRFTSKNNFERVASRLKVLMQNPNQDPRALTKGTENLSESFILELSKSPQATNKYLAKHLLPDLNSKTHFKAACSFYLELPDALLDKKAALANAKAEKYNKKYKEKEDGSAGGRGSNFINSRDLDVSDMPSKGSKESLPMIKRATISPTAIMRGDEDERFSKEFEKVQMQQQLQQHAENINPVEVSKKVLMKCNIIKPKKEGQKNSDKRGWSFDEYV